MPILGNSTQVHEHDISFALAVVTTQALSQNASIKLITTQLLDQNAHVKDSTQSTLNQNARLFGTFTQSLSQNAFIKQPLHFGYNIKVK